LCEIDNHEITKDIQFVKKKKTKDIQVMTVDEKSEGQIRGFLIELFKQVKVTTSCKKKSKMSLC